jgi:hypothetical protein
MEIVGVDVIGSQPRQKLEGCTNVLWVNLHKHTRLSAGQTEICSKEDFVAFSGLLEPMSEVSTRLVHGIQSLPVIEGRVNRPPPRWKI